MISSFTKASLRSFVICFLSSDKIIIQSSSDNQLVNGGFDDITAKDLLLPLQQVDGVAQGRSQVLASNVLQSDLYRAEDLCATAQISRPIISYLLVFPPG